MKTGRSMQKILAWILIITMVISSGINAWAYEPEQTEGIGTEAVQATDMQTEGQTETQADVQEDSQTETQADVQEDSQTETAADTKKEQEEEESVQNETVIETRQQDQTEQGEETLDKKTTRAGTQYDITDWLTNVEIWVAQTDSNGNPIAGSYVQAGTDYVFTNGEYIKIYIEYDIPDDLKSVLSSEDTLIYQLPDYFGSFSEVTDGTVTDGNYSGDSGYYTISPDGLVNIQFYEDYLNSGDIVGGEFSFEGTLQVTNVNEEGETTLTFGDQEVTIQVDTDATLKINKEAVVISQNADGDSVLEYTLTVTAPTSNTVDIESAKVSDYFTLDGGYVNGYEFPSDYIESGGVYTNASGDTITVNSSSFEWELSSIKPGETRTLTYTVKIDESVWLNNNVDGSSENKITNEADVYVKDQITDSDDSTVELNKTWISKSVELSDDGESFIYTVDVNFKAPVMNMNGVELEDFMTGGTILSDITITRYTFDEAGNEILDDTFNDTLSGVTGQDGFSYTFPDGEYGYRFTYSGEVGSKVTNTANIDLGDDVYETTVEDAYIIGSKEFDSYEIIDGIVYMNWIIEVTSPVVAGLVITEHLKNDTATYGQIHQIINESMKVYDSYDNLLTENVDYVVTEATGNIMSIEFLQDFNDGVKVTCQTQIPLSDWEQEKDVDFTQGANIYNRVTVTEGDISKDYNDKFTYYGPYSLDKTLPSNYYDPEAQTITWRLTVNRLGTMSGTAYILEELPEGLEFVSAEITDQGSVYNGVNDPVLTSYPIPGTEPQKVELTLENLQYGSEEGKKDGQVVITLVTKITDENFYLHGGTVTFTNKATIVNDFTELEPLLSSTSKAVITPGTVKKSSVISGSRITYTIDINKDAKLLIPDAASADMQELYVLDEWGDNLTFHRDTLKVYKVEGTTETLLVADQDYRLEVDTAARQFRLYLEDETYYKVVYDATVSGAISETVEIVNQVALFGKLEYVATDEKNFTIQKNDSSSTTKPNLNLMKYITGTNDILPGAEFTIAPVVIEDDEVKWEDEANRIVAIESQNNKVQVTNSSGQITFTGLEWNILYVYWESGIPDGYKEADSTDVYHYVYITQDPLPDYVKALQNMGVDVIVNQSSPSLEVENSPIKVKILKTDEETGAALAGAKMALYDAAGNLIDEWISTDTAHVLEGKLAAGAVYTLKEIEAPDGYLLAANVTFTIPADGSVVEVVMKDRKYTDLYSVEVTKYVKYNGAYRSLSYSFYAAMFWDEACTQRATEVKELRLEKSYCTTTIFDKLAEGTYYLAETDAAGNAVDVISAAAVFTNEITNGVITLTPSETSEEVSITNHLKDSFGDYLYEDDGEIIINKSVLAGSTAKKVTDTFYFTLYSDAAMKHNIATESLELNKQSEGRLSFSHLAYGMYYIAESDANGVPVDETYAYAVSVSESEVLISDTNKIVEIQIENDLGDEETSSTEEETDSETDTETDTEKVTKNNTTLVRTTTASKSVKTEDMTNILLWIILSITALIGVTLVIKKRRN